MLADIILRVTAPGAKVAMEIDPTAGRRRPDPGRLWWTVALLFCVLVLAARVLIG